MCPSPLLSPNHPSNPICLQVVLCMSWSRWQMFEVIGRHRVRSSCSHGRIALLTGSRCVISIWQLCSENTRPLVRLSASLLDMAKADRPRASRCCLQLENQQSLPQPPSRSNRKHFGFSVLFGGFADIFLLIQGQMFGKQSPHCI